MLETIDRYKKTGNIPNKYTRERFTSGEQKESLTKMTEKVDRGSLIFATRAENVHNGVPRLRMKPQTTEIRQL